MNKKEINMEDGKKVTIGTQATLYVGSDCYPYVVVDILRNGQQVVLQEMDAKPAEGFDYFGNQKYIYTINPQGHVITANKKRSNGRYYNEKSTPVSFGVARKYSNPSF